MILSEGLKITQKQIDDILNDPGFRIGFEAEFLSPEGMTLGEYVLDMDDEDTYHQAMKSRDDSRWGGNMDSNYLVRDVQDAALGRLAMELSTIFGERIRYSLDPKAESSNLRLTTDESIEGDDLYDLGVEFITPPRDLKSGLSFIRTLPRITDTNFFVTNKTTGFHINLSHSMMKSGVQFDYAKIAFLMGEEHYLTDFRRYANQFATPLLTNLRELILRDYESPKSAEMEKIKSMTQLGSWNADMMFQLLRNLMTQHHHMSVDLTKLKRDDPYVEFRIAGNEGYEHRADDMTRLILRFCVLIKAAFDPEMYRREYLVKIYRFINEILEERAHRQNPFTTYQYFFSQLQPMLSDRYDRIPDLQNKPPSEKASYVAQMIMDGLKNGNAIKPAFRRAMRDLMRWLNLNRLGMARNYQSIPAYQQYIRLLF